MKVTRVSGLPIEPEEIRQYQTDLETGLEKLNEEMGRFETLSQKEQGKFVRRFEDMREQVRSKYTFEVDWDFETVLQSKAKLKELCNKYGVIGFARGAEDKKLRCFIIDK